MTMCLSKIDKKTKAGPGRGYKILHKDRRLAVGVYSALHGRDLGVGVWTEDPSSETIYTSRGAYPTGFHVQLERPLKTNIGATEVILEVEYDPESVVASGLDNFEAPALKRETVVARRIRLLREVDGAE
jgi:hypothetical protein